MDLLSFDFDDLYNNKSKRTEICKTVNYQKYVLTQTFVEGSLSYFSDKMEINFTQISAFLKKYDAYYNRNILYNLYPLVFNGQYNDDDHKNYCETFELFLFMYSFCIEMVEKYKEMKKMNLMYFIFGSLNSYEDQFSSKILEECMNIFEKYLSDIETSLQLDPTQHTHLSDDFKYVLMNIYDTLPFNEQLSLSLYDKNSISIQFRIQIQIKLLMHYSNTNVFNVNIFSKMAEDHLKFVDSMKKNSLIDVSITDLKQVVRYIANYYHVYPSFDVSILLWSILWIIKYLTDDLENLFLNHDLHTLCDMIFMTISTMIEEKYLILNTFFTRYLIRYMIDLQQFKYEDCHTIQEDIPIIFSEIIQNEKSIYILASMIDLSTEFDQLADILRQEDLILLKQKIDEINTYTENDEEGVYTDILTSTYIIDPFPLHNGDKTIFLDKQSLILAVLENGVNPFTRECMTIYDIISIANNSKDEIEKFKKEQIEYEKKICNK
jgi:hypothetical protein